MSMNSSINPYGHLLNQTTVSVKDHLLTAPFTETSSSVTVIRGHVQSVFCNSISMKDGQVQSRFQISDSVMDGHATSGFWILSHRWMGKSLGLITSPTLRCETATVRWTELSADYDTHTPAACSVLDTGIPLWIPRIGFNTYELWLNYCFLTISLYHRHFQ
jgi:hypothetical protein